ncbi:MAG: hydrogen gas-evolving membrane-bound hydrogenase subunit E [Halanaerobiaceae bacterium]
MRRKLVLLLLVVLGGLLFVNLSLYIDLGPVPDKIAEHYIESGVEETGAYNLVTAILYDYRAFDSLGESTVIFAAVSGIVLILSRKTLPVSSHGLTFIVKRTFGVLTPFVFIFSIYIITHAHLSPGGGFQGGVVLGTISIIFSIVYGSAFDYRRYSPETKTALETGGALIFIGFGLLGIFFQGAFLDNLNFISGGEGSLLSAGSIPYINLGIGIKVGAGLAIIFYSMIQKTFGEGLNDDL